VTALMLGHDLSHVTGRSNTTNPLPFCRTISPSDASIWGNHGLLGFEPWRVRTRLKGLGANESVRWVRKYVLRSEESHS